MKISEVRAALEKHSKGELHHIIAELYKSTPKNIKEECGFDALITDPKGVFYRGRKKSPKKIDIHLLSSEITEFITNAREGYYCYPNRVVPKQQRSKWRFLVKKWYKELLKLSENAEHAPVAAQLLESLFTLLSCGSDYRTFSSEDPFASIQVPQGEFFSGLVNLKFKSQPISQFVDSSIELILETPLSRETITLELIDAFIQTLKTPDLKELTLSRCESLMEELEKPPKIVKKRSRFSWNSEEYERKEKANNIVDLYFHCSAALYEYERGITFFKHHYVQQDKEIRLYCLLSLISSFKQRELWLREYDDAVKSEIEPRESLQDAYRITKSSGIMPEYM